ncbi:MAG: hypothetical protein EBR28_14235, partial [Planctomycetia bacterium]|nr:hypothetical protein [Planctomycetia bacterium]
LRMVLGAGGGGTIDTNGFTTAISSTISGTGGLTKAGLGVLTLTAANTYSGTTTINAGTLRLGNVSALSAAAPVTVNAGTLELAGNSVTLASLSGTSASGGITSSTGGALTLTATAAGSTTYAGAINDGAATIALAKIGSGTLALTGSSGYTGGTRINAGVLSVGNAAALGTSGSITFGGGTLQYAAGNAVDYSSRILGSGTSSIQIDTNGQSVTWASALDASNTGAFTKTGAGSFTFTGSSLGSGTITLNGGTTTIDPGVNGTFTATNKINVGNAGGLSTLNIASGTVNIPLGNQWFTIGDSGASGTATMNVTGGSTTLTANRMLVGNKIPGYLNVSGGILTVAGSATPIMMVGGEVTYSGTGSSGFVTVSGGTLAVTGSTGNITLASGTGAGTWAGTINLNGGEFQTSRPIVMGSATSGQTFTSTVNFNGGVLRALASNTSMMTGLTAAYVQNGGASINTNGFDVTIGQALLQGTGGSTGGLTKSGAGTLTLTGASTYTGATTISSGTLALSGGTNRLGTAST